MFTTLKPVRLWERKHLKQEKKSVLIRMIIQGPKNFVDTF